LKHNLKTIEEKLLARRNAWKEIKAMREELQQLKKEWKKALPICSQSALIEIDEVLGENQQ